MGAKINLSKRWEAFWSSSDTQKQAAGTVCSPTRLDSATSNASAVSGQCRKSFDEQKLNSWGKQFVQTSMEEQEIGSIAVGKPWDARMQQPHSLAAPDSASFTQLLPALQCVCKQRENAVL